MFWCILIPYCCRASNAAVQVLLVDALANDRTVCFSRLRGGPLDIINLIDSTNQKTHFSMTSMLRHRALEQLPANQVTEFEISSTKIPPLH